MHSLRRDFITYGLVVAAGLALGFCAPRQGWAGFRAPVPANAAVLPGASGQLALASLEPVSPDLDGAESVELRALRLSESRFEPPTPLPHAQATSLNEVETCPDGALFCDEQGATEWMAGLRMPDLPVHADPKVGRFVQYFTQSTDGRKVFRAWLKRSGRYRSVVAAALQEHLLPRDLVALVFMESGFSPTAVSRVGAVGLWQFMPETARAYGLVVESDYDERRSVTRASEAGAQHLSDLYEKFGSWELALAAYDVGYQGMIQRVRDTGSNDYWTLSKLDGGLPREALAYVPKVLAVAIIINNLDHFGFGDTHVDMPVPTAELGVSAGAEVSLIARASGTSVEHLHDLNPELLGESIPDRGRDFFIHIPASGLARARSMLPRLLDRQTRDGLERRVGRAFDWGRDEVPHEAAEADLQTDTEAGRSIFYRVGDHETLPDIARMFGTSVAEIVETNFLDPAAKLQKGMLLSINVRPDVMARMAHKRAASRLERQESATEVADIQPPPRLEGRAVLPHATATPLPHRDSTPAAHSSLTLRASSPGSPGSMAGIPRPPAHDHRDGM